MHPESSPVVPGGAWGPAWTWAVVAALVLYGLGVWLLRRRDTLVVALAVACAVQLLPLAAPLLLSKDVYAYWSHARIVTVHGANPYRDAPNRFTHDASWPYVDESWRDTPAVYGPTWEYLGLVPGTAAGASHRHAELAYRALAALGILIAVSVVAARIRSAAAVAFLGWNPLVALHFAGGGHNDAWLALLLVLTVAGAASTRGAALAAGTLFKGFPMLFLPFALATTRERRRLLVGLAVAGAVIAVSAFGTFGTAWIDAMLHGASNSSGLGAVHWLQKLGLRYRYAVTVAGAVFVLTYLVLLRETVRRGRRRLSLLTTALCLLTPQLRPWYAVWAVALAAAEEDGAGAMAAFGLTTYLLLADAVSL